MFTVDTDHGSPAYVTPRQLLHMPFGAVLLANLTVKETGHAAAGGIRIYYLKHDGDRFLSSGNFEELYTSDMGLPPRSAERRVGKACVSRGRSRWWQDH